jgi:hypothetical protein
MLVVRWRSRSFARSRRADFETLANAIAEDYVYLDGTRRSWSTVRERYLSRVEAASTADAWAAVIEDALSELHDFHIGVRPGSAHRWLPVPTDADLWAVPEGGSPGSPPSGREAMPRGRESRLATASKASVVSL